MVLGILFLLLIINTFILQPIWAKRRNQKEVTAKITTKESATTYHKFNYSGEVYFEAPDQKAAQRMFKNFQNTHKKFKNFYDKARKEKENIRQKTILKKA